MYSSCLSVIFRSWSVERWRERPLPLLIPPPSHRKPVLHSPLLLSSLHSPCHRRIITISHPCRFIQCLRDLLLMGVHTRLQSSYSEKQVSWDRLVPPFHWNIYLSLSKAAITKHNTEAFIKLSSSDHPRIRLNVVAKTIRGSNSVNIHIYLSALNRSICRSSTPGGYRNIVACSTSWTMSLAPRQSRVAFGATSTTCKWLSAMGP